ncbi:MAG TPA: CoA pyrophosphatase [Cellvibrionaceae bacterium]
MASAVKNRQRLAAVVLLIRDSHTVNPEVLLVKRARHLNSHAGEVGLPGGMVEPCDESLWHTALREAEEEVGLVPNTVLLQQPLVHAFTRQGVEVAPFVALWQQEHPLRLCSEEIESAFWLPLTFLKRDERLRTDIFTRRTSEYWAPAYRFAGHIIWGFTARLLVEYMNTCHETSIGRNHQAPVARFKSA